MYPKLTSESVRQEQEELDIRTLHLLRATVHNEERKLPENWEENPAEHKKYDIFYLFFIIIIVVGKPLVAQKLQHLVCRLWSPPS